MARSELSSMQVIVVGCGVSGLSCAIRLAEQGFPVTILAKELSHQTTSSVAPAYWDPGALEGRQLQWGRVALAEFQRLATLPDSGIFTVTRVDFCTAEQAVEEQQWWEDVARAFGLPLPQLVDGDQVPPGYQIGVVQEILAFDTTIYLPYLVERVRQLGIEIQQQSVTELADLYGDQSLIIHCAGLGARTLAADEGVYPIRGQIVRIRSLPIQKTIRTRGGPGELAIVFQRRNDCVLAGTYQPHNDNREVDLEIAADIMRRCSLIDPGLGPVEVIEHRVGLRPGRAEVRLELEKISPSCAVIHNYGHGSHGYSFSWGCAAEVAELARRFRER